MGPISGPPFGHLLNFFESSNALDEALNGWNTPNSPPPPPATRHPVRTAISSARWSTCGCPAGSTARRLILNPRQFALPLGRPVRRANPFLMHNFFPPFNRISRYRDPGLININTIADNGLTWQAILDTDGTRGPNRGSLAQGVRQPAGLRPRHSGGPAADPTLNNNSPTMFANPFRAYADGYNVPIPALRNTNVDPNADPRPANQPRDLVDATLLRRDPTDARIPLMASQTLVDDALGRRELAGCRRHPHHLPRRRPQPLLPLRHAAEAGQRDHHPLERVRRVDHGGLLRGPPATRSCRGRIIPTVTRWGPSWAPTPARWCATACSR